jgi:hypothetical protein
MTTPMVIITGTMILHGSPAILQPPTIVQSRVSPGLYTAALLYVPFSSWALVGAARDGVARTAIVTALVAGTLMMASVVLGARWLSNASYGG